VDFGIAKQSVADGATDATATGQVLGTPEYMSPEQIRGEKVDFRTDVYAFGIVAYEIFTGRVPFRGDTPVATIFKHLQDAPPFEGPDSQTLPPSVVPVLRRALAKTPAERFDSAAELLNDLRTARAAHASDMSGTTPASASSTTPNTGTLDGRGGTLVPQPTVAIDEPAVTAADAPIVSVSRLRVSRPTVRMLFAAGASIAAIVALWTLRDTTEHRPVEQTLSSAGVATSPSPSPSADPAPTTLAPRPGVTVSPPSGPVRAATLSLSPRRAASLSPSPRMAATSSPSPSDQRIYSDDCEAVEQAAGSTACEEVDVAPKKLSGTSAQYPDYAPALKRGERISVTVSFVVTERGDVTDIDIIEGTGPVQLAAVAYSRWKFTPGLKNGLPVKTRVTRRQTFLGG
jgi:TonB family protein